MNFMSEREKNILDAAKRVFTRYGVKRVNMSDLAEEAGVSRQTLYNVYRNKEDIIRALIQAYADDGVAALEAAQNEKLGLGPLLDVAFEKIAVKGYDMISNSPNAEELIEGFSVASMEEWRVAAARYQSALTEAFQPYRETLAAKGIHPEALAYLVYYSAKATKHSAENRDALLQHLDTLKKLCLAAAKGP